MWRRCQRRLEQMGLHFEAGAVGNISRKCVSKPASTSISLTAAKHPHSSQLRRRRKLQLETQNCELGQKERILYTNRRKPKKTIFCMLIFFKCILKCVCFSLSPAVYPYLVQYLLRDGWVSCSRAQSLSIPYPHLAVLRASSTNQVLSVRKSKT